MIGLIFIGIIGGCLAAYLLWQFVPGVRYGIDIEDLPPLTNSRRPK